MEEKQKSGIYSVKKYFPAGITAFLVIAACIAFFFLLFKIYAITGFFKTVINILQPIIFGLAIAYIINPISNRIEHRLLKRQFFSRHRRARGLSVAFSLIISLTVVYVLGNLVIPEMITSISGIIAELPAKVDEVMRGSEKLLGGDSRLVIFLNEYLTRIFDSFEAWVQDNLMKTMQSWLAVFLLKAKDVMSVVVNRIVGLIVSVYVLFSKESFKGQFKMLFYAVFKPKTANTVLDVLRQSDIIFGGFIIGKLIDSLIIGVLCFILMAILRLPYALLVSTVVGVTNIIPFFGPFIGAIPSALIILLTDPLKGLYFIILVIVLQQVDGNIIGPKILGNTTGLSAFWVIFAILLGGGLFGFAGMLLGVPVFGVIYYLVKRAINHLLRKKSLPVSAGAYNDIEKISEDGTITSAKQSES